MPNFKPNKAYQNQSMAIPQSFSFYTDGLVETVNIHLEDRTGAMT